MAIDVLLELKYLIPNTIMYMNAQGELRSECEKKINNLGLNNSIHFIDDISSWDDLPKYYSKCQIMFLPAIFSNGNFTIMEAMASGMGLIISDNIMGIDHFFLDNENGFVCNNTKFDYLTAFKKFINNNNLLIKHGLNNKNAIKRFSIAETAKLYFNQISSINYFNDK